MDIYRHDYHALMLTVFLLHLMLITTEYFARLQSKVEAYEKTNAVEFINHSSGKLYKQPDIYDSNELVGGIEMNGFCCFVF